MQDYSVALGTINLKHKCEIRRTLQRALEQLRLRPVPGAPMTRLPLMRPISNSLPRVRAQGMARARWSPPSPSLRAPTAATGICFA